MNWWLIELLSIITVGSLILSYRAFHLNHTCVRRLEAELEDREQVYGVIKDHLYDYIEMMDNKMDVVGKASEDDLKLLYAKDYLVPVRQMLTCIRMHEGGNK